MMSSLYIALRYARPGSSGRFLSFVSLIALLSIALGCAALIISLAVLYGFERDLRNKAVKFTSHVQILGFNKRPLSDYASRLDVIRELLPTVAAASPFIAHEAIIRSNTYLDGVLVKGIFPKQDVSRLGDNLFSGRADFSAGDAYEIILGRKLARKLDVDTGKTLILYSVIGEPSLENPPVVEEFTVVGIYETGMAEYDDLYVYIPFTTAAEVFALPPGSASGVDLLLHDLDSLEQTASYLDGILEYPYHTQTLFENYRSMFAWIELQKEPIPLVLGLISIVAVFNIIATLLMLVVEKIRSIGVLRALGMRKKDIRRIFLLQGMTLGLIGTLSGCVLGYGVCWLQDSYQIISLQGEIYFLDAVPIEFAPWHYAIVLSTSLFLSFLATMIPSWIASRIKPLRALRFE